jgi:hypothetical protein
MICIVFTRRPKWHYDLAKSLEGLSLSSKPIIVLSDKEASSFIAASFVFRHKESRAGDVCHAQLSLISEAFADASPVILDSLLIEFGGSLKPIVLEHQVSDQNTNKRLVLSHVKLEEDFAEGSETGLPIKLRGQSDLTLTPGSTRVIELSIPLREPGQVTASSLKLSYRHDTFDLDYTMELGAKTRVKGWFYPNSSKAAKPRSEAHILEVHPRPPKMKIQLLDPMSQYYANETIELRIQINNAEDEAASVKLNIHLFGKTVPLFRVKARDEEQLSDEGDEESRITGLNIGTLSSASTLDIILLIDPTEMPTTYDLHIRSSYHLESDTATPISQMLPISLNVVNAFEANYDLVPRLLLDPWPSLFDYEGISDFDGDKALAPANGLSQSWCLICHYASFAVEELTVVGMEMKVQSIAGAARCNVTEKPQLPESGIQLAPKTMHEARFGMIAQKLSLDDRQPVSLDLAFVIQWRRNGSADGALNTTTMPAGHYLVLGSEPRVLASVFETDIASGEAEGLVHLDITVENPSSHFLTFGLAMEPSDEFAFSGAKQTTLHLLPMSRRTASYRLLPFLRGEFIRPGLLVRDKYFQKVLRIIPTEGMKIDKDGLLVWVPPLEIEETPKESKE